MRDMFGFDISTLTAYQGYFLDEDKLKASASGGGSEGSGCRCLPAGNCSGFGG